MWRRSVGIEKVGEKVNGGLSFGEDMTVPESSVLDTNEYDIDCDMLCEVSLNFGNAGQW